MHVTFRNATEDDAERIAEIYLASRKTYLPYAPLAHTDQQIHIWVRSRLIPTGNVSVVLVDGSMCGFLATSRDGSFGWIDHVYLEPAKVGMNLGSLLVQQAKLLLGPPIRLYTFQENLGARRFYQRHGFREIELSDGSLNEEKTPDVLMEWP